MTDTAYRDQPPTLRSLEQRIRNAASASATAATAQVTEQRLRRVIANTVIGQLVPPGVVKGGTAMKLRMGEIGSRFTPDFDAARAAHLDLDDYLDELATNLREGWHGFTGRLVELEGPSPAGVPDEYIMKPFDVKLSYAGRPWLTVRFELGRDEIGSTRDPDYAMSTELQELFASLGLAEPQPVPVLPLEHQIAQKLHACTARTRDGTNDRAHDLVDLQLIDAEHAIDHAATAATARRLFAARQSHAWPPTVEIHPRWPTIYAEAAQGLGVRTHVEEAVEWANALIAKLDGGG